MKLEKPDLHGRTDRENLAQLETWANNLVDSLNYMLNHMDNTNIVQGMALVTQEEMEEKMQQQYTELREYIVSRTKGE